MVTPEEIRSRTFLVTLRGFDRDEVRAFLGGVADEVSTLQERVRELEAALARAEEAAGAAASATVQEETSSPFAELGQQTTRVLEAAHAAAEEIREQARKDAGKELKTARAAAARIIADGERRRDEISRAVESLAQARVTLSEDLRGVGRTIERMLRELGPEPEVATVREALAAAAREAEAAAEPSPVTTAEAEVEVAAEPPSAIEHGEAEPGTPEGAAEPDRDDTQQIERAEAHAAPPETATPEPTADDAPPTEAEQAAPEAVAPVAEAGEPEAVTPDAEAGEPEAVTPDAAPSEEPADEALVEPDDGAGEEPIAEAGEEPAGEVREEPIDEVREEPADEPLDEPEAGAVIGAAAPRTGEDAEPDGAAQESDAEPDGAGHESDAEQAATRPEQRRARALQELHPRLVRKLKRGLQDLQNATLDALRRSDDRDDVESFLPDTNAVRALSALAEEQLRLANAAGIDAAERQVGPQGDLEPSGRALADQLGSELGGVLVTRLADALRTGFDAGDELPSLSQRVDAVFDRIKNGPAGDVAAVALIRAYEGGKKQAWVSAGVTHRRWVRATEPRCTDPRCVDNASAGAVPLDQRFPSRHDAPPVRPGCYCSTAPAGG